MNAAPVTQAKYDIPPPAPRVIHTGNRYGNQGKITKVITNQIRVAAEFWPAYRKLWEANVSYEDMAPALTPMMAGGNHGGTFNRGGLLSFMRRALEDGTMPSDFSRWYKTHARHRGTVYDGICPELGVLRSSKEGDRGNRPDGTFKGTYKQLAAAPRAIETVGRRTFGTTVDREFWVLFKTMYKADVRFEDMIPKLAGSWHGKNPLVRNDQLMAFIRSALADGRAPASFRNWFENRKPRGPGWTPPGWKRHARKQSQAIVPIEAIVEEEARQPRSKLEREEQRARELHVKQLAVNVLRAHGSQVEEPVIDVARALRILLERNALDSMEAFERLAKYVGA